MRVLSWSEPNYCAWFVLSVSSLPLSVMLSSCHTCIVFVPRALRQHYALAVALHRCNSRLGTKTTRRSWTFSLHEILKCAHLKFTIYSRKQTYIHITSANAVMLLLGSLRLTPIKPPLKNNYDLQTRLVWSNLLLTLRGAMFREVPLNQSPTVRPLKSVTTARQQLAEVKV